MASAAVILRPAGVLASSQANPSSLTCARYSGLRQQRAFGVAPCETSLICTFSGTRSQGLLRRRLSDKPLGSALSHNPLKNCASPRCAASSARAASSSSPDPCSADEPHRETAFESVQNQGDTAAITTTSLMLADGSPRLLRFISLLATLKSFTLDFLEALLSPIRSLNGLASLQSHLPRVPLPTPVKPAFLTFAVCLLLAASLPSVAHAAKTGGRVGGSSFSSSSSSSSSRSRSQSRSGPSHSYSYSNPSSSSSFSRHRSAFPSPNLFSTPFFAPSPFFGGWGSGWGGGWSPFAPRPTVNISMGGRGGGGGGVGAFGTVFNLLVFGMVTYAVVQTVSGFLGQREEEKAEADATRCSVVQLQVGLLGSARTLQADLERIAERSDVASRDGLHYIMQETILALLRHPDYCVYGLSSSTVLPDSTAGETAFNRASMEERRKFQEETVVNVGGRMGRRRGDGSFGMSGDGSFTEYIVVTVVAACEGTFNLPEVKSAATLKDALAKLGSIPVDELQAVEVLWTPQDPSDCLTAQDILRDYPSMHML